MNSDEREERLASHMARLGAGLLLLKEKLEAPICRPVSYSDRVEFGFEGERYVVVAASLLDSQAESIELLQKIPAVANAALDMTLGQIQESAALAMRDRWVEKLRDYRLKCEKTGVELADKEDESSQRMYWRADGAADALEIVERELQSLTLDQVEEKQNADLQS